VGYSIVLPILPPLIERLAGTSDTMTLSRHTAQLTGVYILAIFSLEAPLWGRLSDRRGPLSRQQRTRSAATTLPQRNGVPTGLP
jgi:hypothetical protein